MINTIVPIFIGAWFILGFFAWPIVDSNRTRDQMNNSSLKKRFRMFALGSCVMGPIFVFFYAFAFLTVRATDIMLQILRSIDESN